MTASDADSSLQAKVLDLKIADKGTNEIANLMPIPNGGSLDIVRTIALLIENVKHASINEMKTDDKQLQSLKEN